MSTIASDIERAFEKAFFGNKVTPKGLILKVFIDAVENKHPQIEIDKIPDSFDFQLTSRNLRLLSDVFDAVSSIPNVRGYGFSFEEQTFNHEHKPARTYFSEGYFPTSSSAYTFYSGVMQLQKYRMDSVVHRTTKEKLREVPTNNGEFTLRYSCYSEGSDRFSGSGNERITLNAKESKFSGKGNFDLSNKSFVGLFQMAGQWCSINSTPTLRQGIIEKAKEIAHIYRPR